MRLERRGDDWDRSQASRNYRLKQFATVYLITIIFMIIGYGFTYLRWKYNFADKFYIVAPLSQYRSEHLSYILVAAASIVCNVAAGLKLMPTQRAKLLTAFVSPLNMYNLSQIITHVVSLLNLAN